MSQKREGGCHTPTFHLSLSILVFFVLDRHDRSAPAEREMTGATPPFWPLTRIVEWGGVPPGITPGVTPHYGVAPVRMYPCGKATRPGRGPDGPPPRGARGVTNSSAPFSSSAASGPRPPGRGPAVCPAADPVAVLVRVHTPNFYRAGVAWDDLTPGWAVFLAGQFLISTSRSWVARMGIRVGRRSRLPSWPLSPTPGRTRGR